MTENTFRLAIVVLLALALGVAAVVTRYEHLDIGNRVDTWTGTVARHPNLAGRKVPDTLALR